MAAPPETPYAHFDQPAFEHMRVDHSISRAAIFFICFLTMGVFFFALVSLPVARLLPIQQLQQLGQLGSALTGGGSPAAVASGRPSGSVGGASPAPATSTAPLAPSSASASAPASLQPSSSSPSSGASAAPSGSPSSTYVVKSGDTLTGIAHRFSTSVQALADANKISPTGRITVGERLTIPSA
ncbi:MAG: LysM peptidoglycan-binding domain-containing protein [Chloroflexota bacterium]